MATGVPPQKEHLHALAQGQHVFDASYLDEQRIA